jgi:hypothetical protein
MRENHAGLLGRLYGRTIACCLAISLLLVGCDERVVIDDKADHRESTDAKSLKPRLLSEIKPAEFKPEHLRVKRYPAWLESRSKGGKFTQSVKPAVDAGKMALLAQTISAEELGRDGTVELRPNGLLIHPGETLPTRVDFDVEGKFKRVTLRAWIGELPKSALSDTRFGTAQVLVLLDDQNYGKVPINRHNNQSIELDLSRVSQMSIIVDNYDKLHSWDWCMIGME